jgi:hypothetical protein
LVSAIIANEGKESRLALAVGKDWKGTLSSALYVVAIVAAFVYRWISDAIYVTVALMWFVPDRRIEAGFAGARDRSGE